MRKGTFHPETGHTLLSALDGSLYSYCSASAIKYECDKQYQRGMFTSGCFTGIAGWKIQDPQPIASQIGSESQRGLQQAIASQPQEALEYHPMVIDDSALSSSQAISGKMTDA